VRTRPRRLGRRTAIPLLSVALITATALVTVQGNASAAIAPEWQAKQVSAPTAAFAPPSIPDATTGLNGIATVSLSEAWAVGHYTDAQRQRHAQVVRYNGTTWAAAQGLGGIAGTGSSELNDVDAVNGETWAVGSYSPSSAVEIPLIVKHAAGASLWTRIDVAGIGPGRIKLYGVDMASPVNGFAVGSYEESPTNTKFLILRWNGYNWTKSQLDEAIKQNPGFNKLTSVTIGQNSIWAVGSWASADLRTMPRKSFILRWDGSKWVQTQPNVPNPAPDVPGNINSLNRVISVSPTEAWAVGTTTTAGWVGRKPLMLRWTNGAWTQYTVPLDVPASAPGEQQPQPWEFTDAYAVSPTEIYFVGYQRSPDWMFTDRNFVQRWVGGQFDPETVTWDVPATAANNPNVDPTPTPTPTSGGNNGGRIVSALSGIAGLPNGKMFAVGHASNTANQVMTKNPQ
jgi:hypothetical protein